MGPEEMTESLKMESARPYRHHLSSRIKPYLKAVRLDFAII